MENEKVRKDNENKYVLAQLVSEHLKEFEGLSVEQIMNCFVDNPQINEKPIYLPFNNDEIYYGVYFKMISPLLNYKHEIICAIEKRDKEDYLKPGELPPVVGMTLLMFKQAKKENNNESISERCYGFYVYTNPSKNLRGTNNRYNIHLKSRDKELLENNTCTGTEIYLDC